MTVSTVGDSFIYVIDETSHNVNHFVQKRDAVERGFIYKTEAAASCKCTNLTDLLMLKVEHL